MAPSCRSTYGFCQIVSKWFILGESYFYKKLIFFKDLKMIFYEFFMKMSPYMRSRFSTRGGPKEAISPYFRGSWFTQMEVLETQKAYLSKFLNLPWHFQAISQISLKRILQSFGLCSRRRKALFSSHEKSPLRKGWKKGRNFFVTFFLFLFLF